MTTSTLPKGSTPPEGSGATRAADHHRPSPDTGQHHRARRTAIRTGRPEPEEARRALAQLFRRLHFTAGLLVGPFLLISALTGFLYALSPMADSLLHRQETTAASTAQVVSLGTQVETAQKVYPRLGTSGIVVGTPGHTTRVMFTDPSLPSTSYRRAVFVDPSNGQVRGTSVLYGSSQAFPERAWLSEVHRRLHLGEPDRIYSELAASWLAPITLAGLVLWWRQRRVERRRARLVGDALDARRPSSRTRARRRHSAIGAAIALGLLFLSATGLTWSKYTGEGRITDLRAAMGWQTPSVSTAVPGANMDMGEMEGMDMSGDHAGHAMAKTPAAKASALLHVTAFQVDNIAAGLAMHPLRAPYEITPEAEGMAWPVKETRRSWINPNSVAMDPADGAMTQQLRFGSYPLAAKLTDWGIRLHMGILFGLANRVLLALLAAALVVVIVHGYRMWWLRRPTRRGAGSTATAGRRGRMTAPGPQRGALRVLLRAWPAPTVLAGLLVAGLCWAVPLFGIPLVLFLVVDSAIAAGRRPAH